MTKSELIDAIAARGELTKARAEMVVNCVFDAMTEALQRGEGIEIRGFGSFTVRPYKPYDGRNPRTGQPVPVPAKRLPFFKVGKELKELVNGSRHIAMVEDNEHCGQNPLRTGLTKVGMPGATVGLQAEDPTIAELLKPLGYATGQFGKNHLGDRNEFLPTVHGFDEFFGNLYHLNAEEEPELPDYPKDPKFKEAFGPRGVMHSFASDKDDATVEPRWGSVGKQTVKDTGPLTKKRMETIDEEITAAALGWMEKQAKAKKPFFLWYNSTAMHFRTHLADKNRGKSGQDDYSDRMVTHDEQIGQMLDKVEELGIADNTIVMYSTDNGPENDTWPDGANTPFRSQKDTNWEGAWRVPAFLRWPGKIKAGSVLNGIVSHQDMLPTLLAAAGDPDVSKKLLTGYKVGDKTFKVHIDGINVLPYITGQVKESPRNYFFYVSDDGGVMAVRIGDWKLVFEEQRALQMQAWAEPMVKLRLPHIFSLRRDPFERADFNSNTYFDWMVDHVPQLYQCQAVVAAQIENYVNYPPRQKAASFNLDARDAAIRSRGGR